MKINRIGLITSTGIAQIISWGSSYYLPAIISSPVTADTGWHSGWVAAALSASLFFSGAVSPYVGFLINRYGGRYILAGGAFLLAAGQTVIGTAVSLPVFLAGWMIIGAGMGACLYDPAFSALGRIYGKEARSAITYVTLFGGFASTICWPLSALITETAGWRAACLVYAAAHIFVVLPVYLFTMPSEKKLTNGTAGEKSGKSGHLKKEHIRPFVLLASGQTLASVVMTVLAVHLITMLGSLGVPISRAVGLGVLLGPSQVAARILEAFFGRRLHPVWSLVIAITAVTAGLSLMAAGTGAMAAGIILYGAGNGLRSIARGTVPLFLFGREGYAIIMGRLAMPVLISQALSPLIGNYLVINTGSSMTMKILFILSVANAVLICFLIPYAFTSERHDMGQPR